LSSCIGRPNGIDGTINAFTDDIATKKYYMKSITTTMRFLVTVLAFASVTFISCKGKQTDAEIEAAINQKIASNAGMKGLNASVREGVVTLTGECKDEECRKDCADAIKDVKGVKNVENNIRIASTATPAAPVEIASDETLKNSVNDVVKNYKGVEADVKDGVVTLRGEIKRDNLQNLIVSLNELKPKKVENQLVIK
jgi:osmotically-inducible protein OsmY